MLFDIVAIALFCELVTVHAPENWLLTLFLHLDLQCHGFLAVSVVYLTFATLAEPHLDVKTLQSVMGHSDIQTTMNRYTHPQERNIIQAVNTLSEVFSA